MQFKNIVNIVLIIIAVSSFSWFIIQDINKNIPVKTTNTVTQETNNNSNWEALIPGATSVLLFFLKYFLIDKKTLKKSKNSKDQTLLEHQLFNDFDIIVENDLKHIVFGSQTRTELMQTLISIQLDTYRSELISFINSNKDFDSWGDFRTKFRTCILDMDEQAKRNWSNRQIPEIVIKKYSSFYNPRIKLLLSDVLTASLTSKTYDDAVSFILNEFRIIVRTSFLNDSLQALSSLNGELTGSIFNGKPL